MNLLLPSPNVPATPDEWLENRKCRRMSGEFRCCGACAIVGILVVFAVLFGGVWIAAKTGLVKTPSFFRGAFEMPEPTRVVYPRPEPPEMILSQLLNPDGTVSGQISERTLTGLLQYSLKQGNIDWIVSDRAQVAMDKEKGLSIFVPVKKDKQETAFRAWVLPRMIDDRLSLDVQEARVGTLPIPFLSSFEPMIQEKLNAALDGNKDVFRLTRFEVGDGYVNIAGTLIKSL